MYSYFGIVSGTLAHVDEKSAIWTHLSSPTDSEMAQLQQNAGIPAHIMKDVVDPNEMPHIDFFEDKRAGYNIENHVLFLDVPVKIEDSNPQNQTRPFCIILNDNHLYTISAFEFDLIARLRDEYIENPKDNTDILLTILFSLTDSYIKAIKEMEEKGTWSAADFKNPPEQNTMFFELLDLQKSMIDFETSVSANHAVVESVKEKADNHFNKHQSLWLDNLLVESEQIGHMCEVLGKVLDATSNISESVVSNNLNDVMKTLTSLTILFSVPTIITAIFTMNTAIPSVVNHIFFPLFFSALAAVLLVMFLKRRKML